MIKEKRVFSRIKIPTQTSLLHKNRSYQVQLMNLSLQGATVQTDEVLDLARGNSCVLRIALEGSEIELDLNAMMMYHNDDNIGFQFSENNPTTVKKLRSIISSNFDKK